MSEMSSFEKMLEESLVQIHRGEIVEGTVIGVNSDEIYVNIGYKSDGIIPRSEYSNESNVDLTKEVKEGQQIKTKVLKVNDGEGQVLLSYKKLKAEEGLLYIEELYKAGEVVTGTVSAILKGGLAVVIKEVRIFIPSSLIANEYVSDLDKFKGEEISFLITEFNLRKNRIIGNRKILLVREREAQLEKVFEKINVGDVIEGVVKNTTEYGAFVNIGDVDGLVHISEISWGRIRSPKDVVKVGEKVKVRVLALDPENKKISLSMKFKDENPWNEASDKYAVGNIIEGRVARMTEFGAFVELTKGVDALLHVSQISLKHVEKPADVLKVNDVITAVITDLNIEEKKISLSIKELEKQKENEAKAKAEAVSAQEEAEVAPEIEATEATEATEEKQEPTPKKKPRVAKKAKAEEPETEEADQAEPAAESETEVEDEE